MPRCTKDADCDNDKYCHHDFKVCMEFCDSNEDCHNGYNCDLIGQCAKQCKHDADCQQNEYCER